MSGGKAGLLSDLCCSTWYCFVETHNQHIPSPISSIISRNLFDRNNSSRCRRTSSTLQIPPGLQHGPKPSHTHTRAPARTNIVKMDIHTLHKSLVAAFSSPKSKPDEVRSLLTKLKIALTEHNLLVPSAASPSSSTSDMVLAREVLEIGAFYSVRIGDIPSFDRYISLLTPFYDSSLPASSHYEPLLGLRLLRLLSSNQISAFHTLIETLPSPLLSNSKYVQHPISLERWLMEGSYSKVWRLSRQTPPQDEYRFFVDLLMDMIRNEIASCEEKAYDSLALHDAATLLFFDKLEQVLKFAEHRGWHVNPTTQVVSFTAANTGASATVIPKKATIASNLVFAKELESIV